MDTIGIGGPKDWVEPKREKPEKPKNLPASDDEDFYQDDAERIQVHKADIAVAEQQSRAAFSKHFLVFRGAHAVCIKCPFEHTVDLDWRLYDLVDGQPVQKKVTTKEFLDATRPLDKQK